MMKTERHGTSTVVYLVLMALFLAGPFLPVAHGASTYPDKPISLVIPLAPGGTVDLIARVLAPAMEKELHQSVIILNKPGGGMTVGGYAVASAKPDGYTLGLFPVASGLPELFSFLRSAPYSSDDLRPISRVFTTPMAIVVKADAPWNSFKELVEHARRNPKMKYAHQGRGGTSHSAMSAIAKAEKLDLVDVPTDGDAALIPAVLGGHVPIGMPAYSGAKALLEAKKLKALALCIDKKPPFASDVPTVVELGYKLPYSAFIALYAPRKIPDEAVNKLDEAVRKVTEDKAFLDRIRELDSLVTYENTATFDKTQARYKADLQTFFKEQGLVK
jgi:tripartite-type tricarboxylate transporter receptor subunit TctC